MRRADIPQHDRADVYRLIFFAWSEGGIDINSESKMRRLASEMGIQWRRLVRSLDHYDRLCQGGTLPVFLLKQFALTLPEIPTNGNQIAGKRQANSSQIAGKMQAKPAKQEATPLESDALPGNHSQIPEPESYPEEESTHAHAPEQVAPFDAFDSQPLPRESPLLPGELDSFEQLVAKIACETSTHHAVKKRIKDASAEIRTDGFGFQDLQDFRAGKGAVALNFLPREMRIWRERKQAKGTYSNGTRQSATRTESAEERRHREYLEDIGALAPANAVSRDGRDGQEIEMFANDGTDGARIYSPIVGTGVS